MLKIKVHTTELHNRLSFLSKSLNKSMEYSYKEMASLTARKMANMTPPVGTGSKQRDILRKSILKDVSNAYWDVGRTANEIRKHSDRGMEAAYLEAVKSGNMTRADEIVKNTIKNIQDFEYQASTSHLKESRTTIKRRVPKTPSSAISVVDSSSIKSIKSESVLKAGLSKSGWMDIVSKLGGKSVASWLRKVGTGSYQMLKSGTTFTLSIINEVRYSSNLLSQSEISKGVNQAVNNQLKRMQYALDNICKKV